MGADAVDRAERQRRELEEIRRSFTEIGTRMGGSLFESAQERQEREAGEEPEESAALVKAESPARDVGTAEAGSEAPPTSRRLPSWAVPVAIALVCLLLGGGLGYLLHRPAAASVAPTATSVTPGAVPPVKPPPPAACLQTARLGDQTIDLLIRNIRDRRLSSAFKAYTEASQACRKEASP